MVRDRTKLVIFLGTPHRGSAYAGWGQIASNLARVALQDSNKRLLETLEIGSLCGFGQGVPRPFRDLVQHYGDEVLA